MFNLSFFFIRQELFIVDDSLAEFLSDPSVDFPIITSNGQLVYFSKLRSRLDCLNWPCHRYVALNTYKVYCRFCENSLCILHSVCVVNWFWVWLCNSRQGNDLSSSIDQFKGFYRRDGGERRRDWFLLNVWLSLKFYSIKECVFVSLLFKFSTFKW